MLMNQAGTFTNIINYTIAIFLCQIYLCTLCFISLCVYVYMAKVFISMNRCPCVVMNVLVVVWGNHDVSVANMPCLVSS